MKIILTKDDKKLGKKNSIVEVKNGYGTFLVRQGTAVIANKENLAKLERDEKLAQETDVAIRRLANQIKDDIENTVFHISISYNKDTLQLNGSITKKDVLDMISNQFPIYNFNEASFIDFPKTRLAQLYVAKLKLYNDIVANVKFGVEI